MTIGKFYNAILRRVIKKSFPFWQKVGFHITINHFYEPIPDTRTLNGNLWSNNSKPSAIDFNEKEQLELLSHFVSKFKSEYELFPKEKTTLPNQYYLDNGRFSSVDAEILYSLIRSFKPKKIFEIGGGYTTYLSSQAILTNKKDDDSYRCQLRTIEPYPELPLKAGFPGLSELLENKVQDIPAAEFKELSKNDILFVDSSHVIKIGSDVEYIFSEILPRLNKGVLIHFHDIFLPAEYPQKWVLDKRIFWNEQYLLKAFLSFNSSFEVLWAGQYMHLQNPAKLETAFNSYKSLRNNKKWVGPGSFWIKRIK